MDVEEETWVDNTVMPRSQSPPKPTRRLGPVYKSKESLFLHKFVNLDSSCIQHIGLIREPQDQLGRIFIIEEVGVRDF